jgi:hypothetical protein
MEVFCTLFNLRYIAHGLALYRSLNHHYPDMQLHVFAIDEVTAQLLNLIAPPKMVIHSPIHYQTPQLKALKEQRDLGSYCWTLTPYVLDFMTQKLGYEKVTYLDADLYFYDSPQPIFDELGKKGFLAIDHRYSPAWEEAFLNRSGRFCVQFQTVQTPQGAKALSWWMDRCIEKCDRTPGRYTFGDQGYLERMLPLFPDAIHILDKPMYGALWNEDNYSWKLEKGKPYVKKAGADQWDPIIFYHFHSVKFSLNKAVNEIGISSQVAVSQELHRQYIRVIEEIFAQIDPICGLILKEQGLSS